MRALLDHSWPGNIRELEHALERALLLARGDHLAVGDFPPEIAGAAPPRSRARGATGAARDAWERRYLEDLLREAGGSGRQGGRAVRAAPLHALREAGPLRAGRGGQGEGRA